MSRNSWIGLVLAVLCTRRVRRDCRRGWDSRSGRRRISSRECHADGDCCFAGPYLYPCPLPPDADAWFARHRAELHSDQRCAITSPAKRHTVACFAGYRASLHSDQCCTIPSPTGCHAYFHPYGCRWPGR
jgi:hypothetical protein